MKAKNQEIPFKSLVLILLLALSSCGDGEDGDSTVINEVPQEEEETPGNGNDNNNGEQSCLTQNQRTNITSLFNALASDPQIVGATYVEVINEDGTTDSGVVPASAFSFDNASDSSWAAGYALCTSPTECGSASATYVFRNNCFFVNDRQANILSSSKTRLRYSTRAPDGTRLVTSFNRSSGALRYSETYSTNGRTFLRLNFDENSSLAPSIASPEDKDSILKELKIEIENSINSEQKSLKELFLE